MISSTEAAQPQNISRQLQTHCMCILVGDSWTFVSCLVECNYRASVVAQKCYLFALKMSLTLQDWTPDYFIANEESCKHTLNNAVLLNDIPLLNNRPLHDFKDKDLVRFCGMVLDMYNPEYYFQTYEVKDTHTGQKNVRSGMYADTARCSPHEEIDLHSEKNKRSERQTCVVISIPGLNTWAKARRTRSYEIDTTLPQTNTNKRHFDEDNDEAMDCDVLEPNKKKEKVVSPDNTINTDEAEPKQRSHGTLSKEHMLNFPVPNDDGKACIVKIYDDNVSLKLNQMIEIIGFISLDPMLSSIHDSEEMMDDAELSTHNPPASLIPRIHAIKVKELTKQEILHEPQIISKASLIRGNLHTILSQLLFGDHLAADYLICHLLSSIYMRNDFLCLGSYPLNITHFPIFKGKRFPKELYDFLTLFVRKSHFLEITLESLNDLSLRPKKDYECNRLTSGILQLTKNTHLVIDETGLTSGQVSQQGQENYNAITDLIKFQKVTYDFKYYTMEYEADIPVLILSEVKSFLPCATQVALKTDADSENMYPQVIEAARHYLRDESRLCDIRQYLEVMRHMEFKLNDDITDTIQEDFVRMRQENKNISVDNLHSMIVLARLMSLSHGFNSVTMEYWKKTTEMETERHRRLLRDN